MMGEVDSCDSQGTNHNQKISGSAAPPENRLNRGIAGHIP